MYDELTFEYVTERMLIERVAVQYVRWQRAIKEESIEIAIAGLTELDGLALHSTFNLTDEQARHYAFARFRGELHEDEKPKRKSHTSSTIKPGIVSPFGARRT